MVVIKLSNSKSDIQGLRSINGICNGAIGYATYDFLLVFHCNNVSILHQFRDIITYFSKFKEVT